MSSRSIRRAAARASAGAGLSAGLALASAAHADTFEVTSLDDDPSGGTTLREAIEDQANGNGEDDVIVFQSGLSGTIEFGLENDINITGEGLEIQGPGADVITVDANAPGDRVFDLLAFDDPDEQVLISGLTLTGGEADGEVGGAIESQTGGVPYYAADLTIANSVLRGNSGADAGGAVFSDSGSLTITNSVLSGNEAENAGGAIYVYDTDNGGLLIDASTISDNTVYWYGGGVAINSTSGPTTIQNTTISGNTAEMTFSYGGGIYFGSADPAATIRNSTITANSSSGGGGIYLEADGPVAISSSIVAGNTAEEGDDEGPDLGQETGNGPPAAEGFELGFSLVGDYGPSTITESPDASNIFGVDPELGPLQDNGGATPTHLPAQTSPAIDQGVAGGLATDQRGLARTGDVATIANAAGGDGTDIGAVELGAALCQGLGLFSITGTAGDDSISGTAGPDPIFGFAGNDSIDGLAGNDCVDGGEGDDALQGSDGDDQVGGGPGSDSGRGGPGNDELAGDADGDGLGGNAGRDRVTGGAGKGKLKGGGGKDRLKGQAGRDKLSGGGGKDRLKGGPGRDRIKPGGGRDRINCGGGKDKVVVAPQDKVSQNCERVVESG